MRNTGEGAGELARLHRSTTGNRHGPDTCTEHASRSPFRTTPSTSNAGFALAPRTDQDQHGDRPAMHRLR